MTKITPQVLVTEYTAWYKDPGFERFGQYMYNKYFSDGEPWPELFYEKDTDVAFAIIANNRMEA